MTDTKRGILILCLGHPYWGRYAHNLAVSIKQTEPTMPVALVWCGAALDHLTVFHLADIFDYTIEAPRESYTKNNHVEFIKAKTWVYDLSPFEETICLDADMILTGFKKPSELFELLKDVDFTAQSRGYNEVEKAKDNYSIWAVISEVRKAYELPESAKFYQVSSEFMYFKKCERIADFYAQVKINYDNLKVAVKIPKPGGGYSDNFGGGIPDELPLAIAMMQKGIYPHQDTFVPIFWQRIERKVPHDLRDYFGLSAGGATSKDWTKKNYDRLVQYFFNQAGLRYVWTLKNKRDFLPERVNM